MNLLDVLTKVENGDYRSDRFTAVPFVTFADLLGQHRADQQAKMGTVTFTTLQELPQAGRYSKCGAALLVGTGSWVCHKPDQHNSEHDWAQFAGRNYR